MILGRSLGISASFKSGAASLVANPNEEICLCLLPCAQPQDGKLELGLNRLRGEGRVRVRGHGVLWRLARLEALGGGGKCLDGNV